MSDYQSISIKDAMNALKTNQRVMTLYLTGHQVKTKHIPIYIKKKTSLDIKGFEKFIKARSEVLLEKLKNILKI